MSKLIKDKAKKGDRVEVDIGHPITGQLRTFEAVVVQKLSIIEYRVELANGARVFVSGFDARFVEPQQYELACWM